ncbi:MAG: PD40 domain-containing protein [Alphaproteobacteria bacterium]|nr:PD40 domain-containing protein [Alphaproteobacteria bacterium]
MTFLIAMLASCTYDPTVGTLPDNVGAAFAPCQESEIKFLATKHNFQTAFEPCGNNNFTAFAWSPDGSQLYFQLGQTGYVMDAVAENRATTTVPTPSPIGAASWLSSTRIALPVGPGPEDQEGPNRIAVFDLAQKSVFYRDTSFALVPDVLRSAQPDHALVVGQSADGAPKTLVRMDLADGSTEKAFDWLEDGFDTLTITPQADSLVVGRDNTVTHYLLDGTVKGTYTPALRGTVHPDGRWLALEHEGDEISIFYQRAWDDMSDAQRRREAQRAERLAETLPDSYPTTVRPPTLSFVDLNDGARWMLTSVHGEQFQWYEASPYYASFIFWGFEGKQFKRNVLLGQMGNRLRATEIGRKFMGVVPMNEIAEARSPEAKEKEAEAVEPEAPTAVVQ